MEDISEEEFYKRIPSKKIKEDIENKINIPLPNLPFGKFGINMKLRTSNSFLIFNRTSEGVRYQEIRFVHNKKNVFFSFNEESDGTQRLLDLLDILITPDRDSVFVIDELDRSLHPQLTYRFALKYF